MTTVLVQYSEQDMDSEKSLEAQTLNAQSGSKDFKNELKTLIDLNKLSDRINLNFKARNEGETSREYKLQLFLYIEDDQNLGFQVLIWLPILSSPSLGTLSYPSKLDGFLVFSFLDVMFDTSSNFFNQISMQLMMYWDYF